MTDNVIVDKPSPFESLKRAHKNYVRVKYVGPDGKNRTSRISGDSVSRALVNLGRDGMVKTAQHNNASEEKVAKIRTATNAGQASMYLSNFLRAKVLAGETVTVRRLEIHSLDQQVDVFSHAAAA